MNGYIAGGKIKLQWNKIGSFNVKLTSAVL